MPHVIQFKHGKKLHLVRRLMGDDYTVCGREIPPDTKIHHFMPESNIGFCKGCYEFIGMQMIVDYLGLDFFYPQSSEVKQTPTPKANKNEEA